MKNIYWKMFESTVTLVCGTKRTYISCTLGNEEDAKIATKAVNWGNPIIDIEISFGVTL